MEDSATKIRLKVTPEAYSDLSVEAFVAYEDMKAGSPVPNVTGLRDFVAAFMVDEDEEPIPLDWARRSLGRLSVTELSHWANEPGAIIERNAVPKSNGTSSTAGESHNGDGLSSPRKTGKKRRGK